MSRNARIASAVAALVVAAVAFVALKPEEKSGTSTPDTTPVTQSSVGSTATTTTTAPKPPPAPKAKIIRVKNGAPVGGVKKITVKQDDTIRFTVSADQAENVHLHGYDIEKPVGPGANARFVVPAKITGVFEVELENAGVQIAKLTVEP